MKGKIFSVKKSICRFLAVAATIVLVVSTGAVPASAAVPKISAKAAILIDGNTGNVLYEKNADKVMYPASTTKIMTAIVALEAVKSGETDLEREYVLSEGGAATLDKDGSSVGLKVGEKMKLKNLLEGLLLASGNDAAVVIAEGIAGTEGAFVERMNAKAKALGLENTHFVNPHGLHHKEHYTTAKDLAIMAREAMKNETFKGIVECAHIYLPPTNMSEKRYFINTNNLVSRMRFAEFFYDYATGVKTGTTTEAGNCLVASAENGDKYVISVVLNAEKSEISHNESRDLLRHAMNDFKSQRLAKRDDIFGEVRVKQASDGTDHLLLSAESNLDSLFPMSGDPKKVEVKTEIPEKVYAPIQSGQVIGKAIFSYEGKPIGEVNLVSTVEIKRHFLGFLMSFGEWLWSLAAIRYTVYIILGIALGFVMILVIGFVRALKKTKRKKRRNSGYRPPRY